MTKRTPLKAKQHRSMKSYLCKLIFNILEGRQFQASSAVAVRSLHQSSWNHVRLSAILYSLFTVDIKKPAPNPIKIPQYVDDLILPTIYVTGLL